MDSLTFFTSHNHDACLLWTVHPRIRDSWLTVTNKIKLEKMKLLNPMLQAWFTLENSHLSCHLLLCRGFPPCWCSTDPPLCWHSTGPPLRWGSSFPLSALIWKPYYLPSPPNILTILKLQNSKHRTVNSETETNFQGSINLGTCIFGNPGLQMPSWV